MTSADEYAAGTPADGLHWSHGDATERSGDRESMG
jgi:hypothetical protein